MSETYSSSSLESSQLKGEGDASGGGEGDASGGEQAYVQDRGRGEGRAYTCRSLCRRRERCHSFQLPQSLHTPPSEPGASLYRKSITQVRQEALTLDMSWKGLWDGAKPKEM